MIHILYLQEKYFKLLLLEHCCIFIANNTGQILELTEFFIWLPSIIKGKKCLNRDVSVCLGRSSVQSLSRVRLLATPWTEAHQASLSITNSRNWLKLMSTESVMPSNISFSVVPLSSCLQSSPASGSFLFQWVSSFHQVAKVLEFQLQPQSFQWIFRTDFL